MQAPLWGMSILSWNAFYLFLFLWWGGGVRHTDRTTWTKLYIMYILYMYILINYCTFLHHLHMYVCMNYLYGMELCPSSKYLL